MTIINIVAMNIEVHVSFQISGVFFSVIYPEVELLSHIVDLFLVLCEISLLFYIVTEPIYIPTNSV